MSITPTPLPESTQPTPRPRAPRRPLLPASLSLDAQLFRHRGDRPHHLRLYAHLRKSHPPRCHRRVGEIDRRPRRASTLRLALHPSRIRSRQPHHPRPRSPGEIPYAHLDRLFVRLQILSFFHPKISLNYLEADHPVIHLIVYPDGSTNQPQPKHPSTGDTKNEIFNLAIGRTVLDQRRRHLQSAIDSLQSHRRTISLPRSAMFPP